MPGDFSKRIQELFQLKEEAATLRGETFGDEEKKALSKRIANKLTPQRHNTQIVWVDSA